jgi:alpha-mannosidase
MQAFAIKKYLRSGICSVIFFICLFPLTHAQVKRLYIADDNHTDYMWTTTESAYDSAFVHMLDYYLDQVDATKNNPDDLQARFNCDGSYWLKVYEKYRTPEQFNRLANAIRSKHISSPLTSLVSTYGAQPTEAVIRGMFDAGRLERKLGLRFRLAVCMEDQTLPLGLSALWAGSGAKYSWKGICGCDTKMPSTGFGKRRHQLYHYTGLDGSKIIMKWYNLGVNNAFLGGYAEARGEYKPKDTLESIRSAIRGLDSLCIPTSVNYSYPYKIAGAFGYGWDDLETYVSPAFINAAKSMTNDSVKIRVSNEEDFFEDVEKTYPHLPAESVTYGNEWDSYSASMNETTARVRRAVEKLRNAEALAAVVWLKNKQLYHSLASLREKAWEGYGLYWEHDWTSDGPVSKSDRARWQIKIQEQITAYSDTLLEKSMTELARQLGKGNFPRFYVFNSLGWVRNDVADIPFAPNYLFDVVDLSTNKKAISQKVVLNNIPFIRIYAENIPSVGYKIFEIRPAEKNPDAPDAAVFSNDYFMNRFYRIRLSRSGAITEIYDSIAKRQLVKPVNGKFVNDIDGSHIDGDALQIENAGPVSITLKSVSDGLLSRVVRVTLFAHTPRIDIDDSIQSNFEVLQTWSC